MNFARYFLLTVALMSSISYTGVDFYRLVTSKPEDHQYPIFYTFTGVWCAVGIISSFVFLHLLILKYMVGRNDYESISPHEDAWKSNSKEHTRTFAAVLLCVCCLGFVIDISYYHLEGTQGHDATRGMMLTLDVVQIILYVFIYHMTLLNRD